MRRQANLEASQLCRHYLSVSRHATFIPHPPVDACAGQEFSFLSGSFATASSPRTGICETEIGGVGGQWPWPRGGQKLSQSFTKGSLRITQHRLPPRHAVRLVADGGQTPQGVHWRLVLDRDTGFCRGPRNLSRPRPRPFHHLLVHGVASVGHHVTFARLGTKDTRRSPGANGTRKCELYGGRRIAEASPKPSD